MQMALLGASDLIQHGGIFYIFHFSAIFFVFSPENVTFYTENILFNSLACKRCLNTSLCCFTTTSDLGYGSETLKYY